MIDGRDVSSKRCDRTRLSIYVTHVPANLDQLLPLRKVPNLDTRETAPHARLIYTLPVPVVTLVRLTNHQYFARLAPWPGFGGDTTAAARASELARLLRIVFAQQVSQERCAEVNALIDPEARCVAELPCSPRGGDKQAGTAVLSWLAAASSNALEPWGARESKDSSSRTSRQRAKGTRGVRTQCLDRHSTRVIPRAACEARGRSRSAGNVSAKLPRL